MSKRHVVGGGRRHVLRPPRFLDVNRMARDLDRFEFVMQMTAWNTRGKKGRELSNGMQARKLSDGTWQVGSPDIGEGVWLDYADPRLAFENARRSGLFRYTTEADNLRVELLS